MSRKTLIVLGLIAVGLFFFVGVPVVRRASETAKLDRLEPSTRRKFETLAKRLAAKGITIRATNTRRTEAEQAKLVAEGKSATQQSWHRLGRAIDAYPVVDGKLDLKGQHVDVFRTYHKEANALGFRSLAFNADGSKRFITTSKGKVWDAGHIEFRGGFGTFAEAFKVEGDKVA